MATKKKVEATTNGSDEDLILDVRELARPAKKVRTSVGDFMMRRITQLGSLERAEIEQLMEAARLAIERVQEGADADPADRDTVEEAESRALREALPDATEIEVESMTGEERGAIIAAFFGASDEEAIRAMSSVRVALAVRSEPPPKPKRSTRASSSRSSKSSTGATRRRG